MAVAGLVALAIVGAHAGLITMGRWQVDEYRLFTLLRRWGVEELPARLEYSPRPFSEGLIFLYGEAVLHLQRPLVTSFLAVLWTGMVASTAWAARAVLPHSAWHVSLALAFALALVAAALTGAGVTEAFYWPMGAAAYMPTLAAGICLFFLTEPPMDRGRRAMSGAVLGIAACSSEMGAALAFCFALAAVSERAWAVLRRRIRAAAAVSADRWYLLPGAASVLVFLAILHVRSRYGVGESGAADVRGGGQVVSSALAALRDLAAELVIGSSSWGPRAWPEWQATASVAARLLFVAGFAASWRRASPGASRAGRERAALAAALLGAAFLSIAGAYQHYGELCCERQQSVRQSFLTLGLVVAASAAWRGGWPARRAPALAPLVLAAGLLVPLAWRLDELSGNYALYHWNIEARARTWTSGLRPGTRGMIFYLPPDRVGLAVHGTGDPQRTYGPWADAPNLLVDMGRFFDKHGVTVCEPWQTDRSWVINGRFIPACVLPPES